MQRLIDADALEKSLTEKGDDYKVSMFATADDCNIARLVAFECAEEVKNAPTIEAEPVRHGKWEWFEDWGEMPTSCLSPQEPPELYDYGWRCSCCKEYISSAVDVRNIWDAPDEEPVIKRCPNCGAKMDLEG